MRFDERDNKKRKYWKSKWKNTHFIRESIALFLIILPTLKLLNQCGCGRTWWWRQYHQCLGDVPHTKHGANCKAQIWKLLDVFYYLVSPHCFSRIYMKNYGLLCLQLQYNLWSMVIFWNKVNEVKEWRNLCRKITDTKFGRKRRLTVICNRRKFFSFCLYRQLHFQYYFW